MDTGGHLLTLKVMRVSVSCSSSSTLKVCNEPKLEAFSFISLAAVLLVIAFLLSSSHGLPAVSSRKCTAQWSPKDITRLNNLPSLPISPVRFWRCSAGRDVLKLFMSQQRYRTYNSECSAEGGDANGRFKDRITRNIRLHETRWNNRDSCTTRNQRSRPTCLGLLNRVRRSRQARIYT